MTITEREKDLFSEWKRNREGFVEDGVIDEKSYLKNDLKILFVMKEVNDPGGGNWDLRQFIREGARSQTWDNITRWVAGIRCLPNEIYWAELAKITIERRIDVLRSICVINLKKSPGGHTTDNKALWGISSTDKEYINRQLSLYDADVTICCGSVTSNIFHSLVSFTPPPEWVMTKRGIWYHQHSSKKIVISYAHPEARVTDCLLYYGIIDAVKEILTNSEARKKRMSCQVIDNQF